MCHVSSSGGALPIEVASALSLQLLCYLGRCLQKPLAVAELLGSVQQVRVAVPIAWAGLVPS